jgi:hypothetical protein
MKQVNGSPRLFLASSELEKAPGADSDNLLRSVIASLEECRALLCGSANRDAAQLVAMAVLQLRMRLHQIADSELKALCDAIIAETNDNPDLPEASRSGGS